MPPLTRLRSTLPRLSDGKALAAVFVATLACAVPSGPCAASGVAGVLPTPTELDRLAAESVRRWELSPHGQMLMRIVPRQLRPSELPDAGSEGARLTALYCVQCHYLPSPATHEATSWERIVRRMIPRMRGEGNMGELMAAMMLGPRKEGAGSAGSGKGSGTEGSGTEASATEESGSTGPGTEGSGSAAARPLSAPSPAEAEEIVTYLRQHVMHGLADNLSPKLHDDLSGEDGQMFVAACGQCHVLPDPASHSASEWPAIVRRMEQHMRATNRVADTLPDPREPQLEPAVIIGFLQRHAP